MKEIKLTKGFVALVDDEDYEKLAKLNWRINKDGYATAHIPKNFRQLFGYEWPDNVLMHRLIIGAPKGSEVDHKDCYRLNNQKSNLRFATKAKNQMNSRSRPGTSRFKGVSWKSRDSNWRAVIVLNNNQIFLGSFASELSAAKAYDSAAAYYFKEFAKLNFPDSQPEPYRAWVCSVKSNTNYIGVTVSGCKFSASCKVNKRQTYLGSFESAYDAALYRDHHLNKYNLIGRRNFEQ